MRRVFPIFATAGLVGFAILAACVGEDPDPVTPAADSGGSSSGTTSSGGSSGASSSGASSSGASSSGGSSGSPDGGDASKPYDVRSLTGLKLWLESTKELTAGSGGGTPLATWADQSGAWADGGAGAPDGGRHIVYPDGINTPTIEANGINGRPTVFVTNGNASMKVATHDDFQFGVGDFLIVFVAKVTAGTGALWSLGPPGSAGYAEHFFRGKFCMSYGQFETKGCTTPEAAPTSTPHVHVARRQGDIFSVRVDGTEVSSIDRTGETTNIFISPFARPDVFIAKNLDALVSEIIVVVGPTTNADLTTLENHLEAKYAIQ